jgi:hypothetical protein
MLVTAKIFFAAFIDGYHRLTDIAAGRNFSMQLREIVANFSIGTARLKEGAMPRTDNSIRLLTGMIIAALYVILLVGFSRESYMRRDAASRTDAFAAVRPAIQDVSNRACRVEPEFCAALFADPGERKSCAVSLDAVRRIASLPMAPLTLEGLRRAMREEP